MPALFVAPAVAAAGWGWNGGASTRSFAVEPPREEAAGDAPPFVFRDVAEEAGLFPHAAGIRGHGAAWGDVDGDGWIDLYVATFDTGGSKPNMLLRNRDGKFRLDEQESLRASMRGTGVVCADLDNDGDLDLYVGSMPAPEGSRLAQRVGRPLAGCTLFRNDGEGRFANISRGNGACPPEFGGRSVAVLDYDGDGLLDLLVGEDPNPGYNGSPTNSSRLFRNLGDLRFEDVSRKAGLPEGIPGLGVAAADVNDDGWPDFFLASSGGGNRLFLNDGDGSFQEAPGAREVFDWPTARGDNMVCGVCIADVNRDGLLDIVLGQHYDSPWREPVANRLYLNRGIRDRVPRFEDVTEPSGLVRLPMKAPHVEIQDFDNDGWPDIYTSIVKFADRKPHPVIFRNLGVRDGLPRFREDALGVNDFPTAEDRSVRRSGDLFEKILREGKIIYMAPGPSGDFDNDGRLDLFLPNWWAEAPSLLLRNETPGGNWLQVRVEGADGVNRMGIGARVNVYPAGNIGEAAALLGIREIATGFGYASGQPALAHFGLGKQESVDLEVILPHGRGRIERKDVRANQRITIGR
ncbi:MAG: CRTAC1 family protein [Planctomycetaceae bacterium]